MPADEEVAAELGRRRLLDAEAVHAVDAQQHTLALGPAPVRARARPRRSSRSGSFTPVPEWTHVTATHAFAGRSRASTDARSRPRDAAPGRRRARTLRIAAPVRSPPQPQRLVGGVVVVLGRERSRRRLADAGRDTSERGPSSCCRSARCHRATLAGSVPAASRTRLLEPPLVGVEVLDRVRVEFATVLLDRLADLPWVGREQERREVKEVRLQVEEIANAGPAARGRRRVQARRTEQPAPPSSAVPATAAPSPRNSRLPRRPSSFEGSVSRTSTAPSVNRCTLLSNMIALRAAVCIAAVSVAGCASAAEPETAPPDRDRYVSELPRSVSTARLRQHLAALQRVADAHGGTRVAGGPGYAASVRYVRDELAAAGYRPKVSTFPFTSYRERREVARQLTPVERTIRVEAIDYSPSTPTGGLRGRVAPADNGCEPGDFAGTRGGSRSPAEASASSSRRRRMRRPPARPRCSSSIPSRGRSTPRSAIRTPRRFRSPPSRRPSPARCSERTTRP